MSEVAKSFWASIQRGPAFMRRVTGWADDLLDREIAYRARATDQQRQLALADRPPAAAASGSHGTPSGSARACAESLFRRLSGQAAEKNDG